MELAWGIVIVVEAVHGILYHHFRDNYKTDSLDYSLILKSIVARSEPHEIGIKIMILMQILVILCFCYYVLLFSDAPCFEF